MTTVEMICGQRCQSHPPCDLSASPKVNLRCGSIPPNLEMYFSSQNHGDTLCTLTLAHVC